MHLTDKQIIDILIEYTTDTRYKQTILIDGDWGSGKTYFVQEKLMTSLKNYFEKNHDNQYEVIYISLYGMESFSQIMDDIYTATIESFFAKKLSTDIGEKIGKGINFTKKLLITGMKYFNLDKDDLPKLSDIKELKNLIIIFDDFERCSIGTNQLLGFINNLVEHNAIKVIIVANQAEIGTHKLVDDLPQKYSVVLNPQLILEEEKDIKVKSAKKEATLKRIGSKELKEFTEQIFSDDIVYEKIKEKLIGLTINYKADFGVIYDEIVCEYIKDQKTKKILSVNKERVVDVFNQKKHNNIRTLIFSLMAFEKIFNGISEIDSEIDFEQKKFVEDQYRKLLHYIVVASIQIKVGQPLCLWENVSSQTALVYLGKDGLGKDGVRNKRVFAYRFVDIYLTTCFFEPSEAKKIILELLNEAKEIDQNRKAENALKYNTLSEWWLLEDAEVIALLEYVINELSEMKYHPRYFQDMILLLMQIQKANFNPFDYKKYCDDFIYYMKQRLEKNNDKFKLENLKLLTNDPALLDNYNSIIEPLFGVLRKRECEEIEKINESLNLDKSWGNVFKSSCENNKDSYISGHKFLFYVSPEKVIERLSRSSVKDIYSFLEGIKAVYSFSNLNGFFKDDIDHISMILDKLDINTLSNNKTTKRIALEKLKLELEKSLTLIKQ